MARTRHLPQRGAGVHPLRLLGAGGRLHVHTDRHTANTLAAATGASTRELMYRMGHASSAAALRYQHATRGRDRAIAQALGDLISGQISPATPISSGTPIAPSASTN